MGLLVGCLEERRPSAELRVPVVGIPNGTTITSQETSQDVESMQITVTRATLGFAERVLYRTKRLSGDDISTKCHIGELMVMKVRETAHAANLGSCVAERKA